ncbi:MAG: substrate-binding domain-containing protein [Fimbriimonas sp.]
MEKLIWQNIADELASRIESGELAPGTRIESEERMASRLQVPRHMVHRALSDLQRQGLLVRQRRWGTVVADRKVPPTKKRIAYIVDVTATHFQSEVMAQIEHALTDGTRMVVATSRNQLEREAEHLIDLQHEVDGILCYPADGDENAQVFLDIAESGFPLVLIDRAPRGCEHLAVLSNNVGASEHAVGDLISRGHKRIAFFGSSNTRALSIRERYAGYRKAVEPLGYSPKQYERWIPLLLEENSEMMFQSISDGFAVMRNYAEPPTAAFCVQDRLASIVMEACTAYGLEIGVDFGLATFNDFGPTFFPQPWRIDRVVQRLDAVSVAAVNRLHALMRGESVPEGPIRFDCDFFPAEDTRTILTSSLDAPRRTSIN